MTVVSVIGSLLVVYLSQLTGKKLTYLLVFVVFNGCPQKLTSTTYTLYLT